MQENIKGIEMRTQCGHHGVISLLIIVVLCSCTQLTKNMRDGLQPKPLTSSAIADKAEIYNEIASAQRQLDKSYVHIEGMDIELPPNSGSRAPAEIRKYQFDVWFDESVTSESNSAWMALNSGDVVVEVLNASARLSQPPYSETSVPTKVGAANQSSAQSPPALMSRNIIRIEVDSRDIDRSFTIVAKGVRHADKAQKSLEERAALLRSRLREADRFCGKECRDVLRGSRERIASDGSRALVAWSTAPETTPERRAYDYLRTGEALEAHRSLQNPYMAVKNVRVYNGDLHTQVYMLSDEEVRDAFGSNFARHFYVGKAYFRNQHVDKKLIVNTTSLRARTLFYREPAEEGRKLSLFVGPTTDVGNQGAARYDYLLHDAMPWNGVDGGTLSVSQENQLLGLATRQDTLKTLFSSMDISRALGELKNEINNVIGNLKGDEERKEKISAAEKFVTSMLGGVLEVKDRCEANRAAAEIPSLSNREALYESLLLRANSSRIDVSDQKPKNMSQPFSACVTSEAKALILRASLAGSSASPISLDSRRRVGLTDKIASASSDVYWQQRLSRHGYLWEDFYRPMTFESVLISLSAKTKSHPANRTLEYLQSLGLIAGALVGLEQISSTFGSQGFAERVAVTTGVFVPELKRLIMKDLDQHLANLAATALPSILTLAPNESRDGYVFFPRGPIYGYGVDEFTLNAPSYIVNIDNEDVAVDGALIEGELQFSAGQKTIETQISAARSQGQKQVSDDLRKHADMQAKLFAFRMRQVTSDVCEMLADNNQTAALSYLNSLSASNPNKSEGDLFKELLARVKANITCDKPVVTTQK